MSSFNIQSIDGESTVKINPSVDLSVHTLPHLFSHGLPGTPSVQNNVEHSGHISHLSLEKSSSAHNVGGQPYLPLPSPLSDARLPEKSSVTHTQLDFIASLDVDTATSPSTVSPLSAFPSTFSSRKPSLDNLADYDPVATPVVFEHMKRRLASACFVFFVCGWGDGVTGTVLPYFEKDFHLSYMTSSLLFAGSTVGFAIGTLLVERVMTFLGLFYLNSPTTSFFPAVPFTSRIFQTYFRRGQDSLTLGLGHSASKARFLALFLGSILHACFFVIMGSRSGYASMLIGYAVAAFSRSYLTASLNAYVAATPKKPLGYILASWSSGSFAAPIVCQTIITTGVSWSHFYFGSLVLSGINTIFIFYAFRPTINEYQTERQAALDLVSSRFCADASACNTVVDTTGRKSPSSSVTGMDAPPPRTTFLLACSMPYQWAFSLFSWIYSGSETTVQGFTVTYLLATRHANPKTVGYVTSGFWGGMAVSRFLLGHYTPYLTFTQRKHIIHMCTVVATTMHILIWFVHSNIENAFSTAVLGLVYGPIFPGTLGLATDVLPQEVHMVSMAIISAFASFGAAFFPFITGFLSNIQGPHILSYVTVGQTAALFCLWCLFPSKKPSTRPPIMAGE